MHPSSTSPFTQQTPDFLWHRRLCSSRNRRGQPLRLARRHLGPWSASLRTVLGKSTLRDQGRKHHLLEDRQLALQLPWALLERTEGAGGADLRQEPVRTAGLVADRRGGMVPAAQGRGAVHIAGHLERLVAAGLISIRVVYYSMEMYARYEQSIYNIGVLLSSGKHARAVPLPSPRPASLSSSRSRVSTPTSWKSCTPTPSP